jgi:hypothetical protein
MRGKYIKGKMMTYDGSQLRSHWAYLEHDVQGNSVVAFRGPCRVGEKDLVDVEDRKKHQEIYSEDMTHFIIELFDSDLDRTMIIQRLFMCIIKEAIEELMPQIIVDRRGDDLYLEVEGEGEEDRKLSVSVATASPVSTLIHAGVNVVSRNTPVPTLGLEDMDISVDDFILMVLQNFINEIKDIDGTRSKISGVS